MMLLPLSLWHCAASPSVESTWPARVRVFNASVAAHLVALFRERQGRQRTGFGDLSFPLYQSVVPPFIFREIHAMVQAKSVRPVCFYDGWVRRYEPGNKGLPHHFDNKGYDEVTVVIQATPGAFLSILQGVGQQIRPLSSEAKRMLPHELAPIHLAAGEAVIYHGATSLHGCRALGPSEERWTITLFYSVLKGVHRAYADNYGVDGVGWSEDREEFEEEQSGMQWHPAAHVAGRMHCRHAYGGARANRCCRYWSRREIVEDPGVTYWKREPESL